MHPQFEAVIGLEVHCQLSTATKIFCSCRARLSEGDSVADAGVNTHTCPVCAGHPGALPVLNSKVVDFAIRAGLATQCRIRNRTVFARKNYFYPDLPKGYQLSQLEAPICEEGSLEIEIPGQAKPKRIGIQRIHMEEDAGKNVHTPGFSLVNLNRAGVPLIEIVSHPQMSTPAEAGAYLRALHSIVTFLGICDGNMQEGNFRCDSNVSVRPRGEVKLGTRVEIKNVNSFRFVEKAIEYEIARQIGVVLSGGRVVQETRNYDSARNVTSTMRTKEQAEDYRYFQDPDLVPVMIPNEQIERIRQSLPELPAQKKARLIAEYGLSAEDAGAIVSSRECVAFFETTLGALPPGERTKGAKTAANFLNGELLRLLNEEDLSFAASRVSPFHLADLVLLVLQKAVSSTGAKQALFTSWKTGDSIPLIVERDGLRQVSDLGALEPAIEEVLVQNPAQVAEFKSGKEKVLGFFVGQVMKKTGGKANPALIQDLIRKKLSK